MSDLISRAEVIDWYCRSECESKFCGIPCCEVEELQGFPSAEPRRRRGRWKTDHELDLWEVPTICSECGHEFDEYLEGYEWEARRTPNYCPHCGADMRGENSETD